MSLRNIPDSMNPATVAAIDARLDAIRREQRVAIPLAIESGTGAELRFPLGISIIGGLIVSQVLTLYTTPVIYLLMDTLRLQFQRRRHDDGPIAEAAV